MPQVISFNSVLSALRYSWPQSLALLQQMRVLWLANQGHPWPWIQWCFKGSKVPLLKPTHGLEWVEDWGSRRMLICHLSSSIQYSGGFLGLRWVILMGHLPFILGASVFWLLGNRSFLGHPSLFERLSIWLTGMCFTTHRRKSQPSSFSSFSSFSLVIWIQKNFYFQCHHSFDHFLKDQFEFIVVESFALEGS